MPFYRDRQNDEERRHGRPEADGLDNRWGLKAPDEDEDAQDDRKRGGSGGGPNRDPAQQNAAILRSTALMLTLCLAFALPQPDALLAPLFSGYLFAASGASLLWGVFTRPPVFARHLTHWDQALFLLAASLFAGLFTDPDAAREAVQHLQNGGAGGTPAGSGTGGGG